MREPPERGTLRGTIRTNLPGPISVGPVPRFPQAVVVEADGSAFIHLVGSETWGTIPDELYLREARTTDPADPQAIASFVMRFGELTGRAENQQDPGPGLCRWSSGKVSPNFASIAATPSLTSRFERACTELDARFDEVIPVDVAAYHLRVIRAMATHLFMTQEGSDPRGAWRSEGFGVSMRRTAPLFVFETFLNAALRPYTPWVLLDPDAPDPVSGGNAFTAMAAQIAKMLLDGNDVIKLCANPICPDGGWFVHQRGTQWKPRGVGVDYCTKRCLEAERKRKQRRRKREEQKP